MYLKTVATKIPQNIIDEMDKSRLIMESRARFIEAAIVREVLRRKGGGEDVL
jgi:hypothetical protein